MLTKEEILFKHLNNRSIELGQGPLESDYLDDPIFKPLFNAVEEYANQDKWISVKDQLPKTNCDVLVLKRNGRVFQMSYHAPFDSGKRIFQWWGFGKWINQHSQVTHWMKLPNPPKQ